MSQWQKFVRAWAEENNCSYGQAMIGCKDDYSRYKIHKQNTLSQQNDTGKRVKRPSKKSAISCDDEDPSVGKKRSNRAPKKVSKHLISSDEEDDSVPVQKKKVKKQQKKKKRYVQYSSDESSSSSTDDSDDDEVEYVQVKHRRRRV